jgi:CRP-like cAMP-binding protein
MKTKAQQKKSNKTSQEQAILEGQEAIVNFLKNIMPFNDTDIQLLFPILQYRQVKKHELLLKEGEVCKNVYYLFDGFFRMFYVDYNGNEINYRFSDKNNFLVDFKSFLLQKPSHFYWQAMEQAELLVLPYADIHKLYAASPAWNDFGRLIAERVYLQLNERVEMLLFMTPEERYKYLLDTQPSLFEQVSQFHLSSYLGIKPESLSRLRKRLLKK